MDESRLLQGQKSRGATCSIADDSPRSKRGDGESRKVVLSMKSTTCVEREFMDEAFKREDIVKKIVGSLPEQEYFQQIEGSSKWPYIWEDKLTPALRICSKVADPWGKQWEIYLSIQTSRKGGRRVSKNSQASLNQVRYPARLDLQLSPVQEESSSQLTHASLIRETAGGKVAYSNGTTLRFFVMEGKANEMAGWVMLSVVEIKKRRTL